MEEEQFQSYQAEVGDEGGDQGQEKATLSPEDQLKLERAAANNAMVYVQQYIKSQSLLQALQVQLTEYQDSLKKSQLEQMREEKRGRNLSPERIEELREVVSFFCPKDPDTLIGKAWVAYHMHSAHAEPVANPGQLLKRSKKDDMLAVWKAHGLNLFEKSMRRDASGFVFNLSALPIARRLMLDMRARGLECASKNPRKRKRLTPSMHQHGHHDQHHQQEHSHQQITQQSHLHRQEEQEHQQHQQQLQHLQHLQHRQQQQQQQHLRQHQHQHQQLHQIQHQLQHQQEQRRQQQPREEGQAQQQQHRPQRSEPPHGEQSRGHGHQRQPQNQLQDAHQQGQHGRVRGHDATQLEETESPSAVHLLPVDHHVVSSEEKKNLPTSPVGLNIVEAVLDGSLKEGPVLSHGFSDLLGDGEDPNLQIMSD